jgi:hypothetical protein
MYCDWLRSGDVSNFKILYAQDSNMNIVVKLLLSDLQKTDMMSVSMTYQRTRKALTR